MIRYVMHQLEEERKEESNKQGFIFDPELNFLLYLVTKTATNIAFAKYRAGQWNFSSSNMATVVRG